MVETENGWIDYHYKIIGNYSIVAHSYQDLNNNGKNGFEILLFKLNDKGREYLRKIEESDAVYYTRRDALKASEERLASFNSSNLEILL